MKNLKFVILLIFISIIVIIASLSIGAANSNPLIAGKILINHIIGFDYFPPTWNKSLQLIIIKLRLSRTLLGFLVGGGLALVGVLMQALTKNSLADPYILGVSSGASTGAVLSLIVGINLGGFGTPLMAFLGAIIAALLVFNIAHLGGNYSSTKLVLTGIAISSFFSAITTFITYTSSVSDLYTAIFWIMGSLGGANMESVKILFIVLIITLLIIMSFHKELDIILLGDDTSKILGVNNNLIKIIIVSTSTLLTGFLVSTSGVIGFVGLIIPHISRKIIGSKHKILIPISVIIGGIFLVLANTLSRTLLQPMELPVGIITSFLGAPFFLWIMKKKVYNFNK